MNCLQAEENFSAHFEDALDYETLQRFESHIAECTTCQHEYVRFQDSVTASQRLPQIEPSPYFLTTLQQRLSEEQRETFSFWQRLQHMFNVPKWALSGAIVLILVAFGIFLYQDKLFNRDIGSSNELSQTEQPQANEQSPSGNNRQFLPRGIGGTDYSTTVSMQPMQQHYILKRVSYATASTAGGL